MEKNHSERSFEVLDNAEEEKESYRHYQELGGIINEADFKSALARAETMTTVDKLRRKEAEGIAGFSKIKLHNEKNATNEDILDRRTILYGILRNDVAPEEVEHHHSEMGDQKIFAQALAISGDSASLDKMIEAYPNISFNYHKAENSEQPQEPEQEYKAAA